MKSKFCLAAAIIGFSLFSCYTVPTSAVAPGVDFSKYEYAAIGSDASGGSAVMDAYMKVQITLMKCGYKVVGDTRINELLSAEEKEKLFTITMGITADNDESVCTINLTDYLSGIVIATCKGSYAVVTTVNQAQVGSIDSAIKQMEKVIAKN